MPCHCMILIRSTPLSFFIQYMYVCEMKYLIPINGKKSNAKGTFSVRLVLSEPLLKNEFSVDTFE